MYWCKVLHPKCLCTQSQSFKMHKTLKALILLTNVTPVNLIKKKKHEQKLIKLQPQYGLCFSTYSTFILFFFSSRNSYSSHRIDSVHFLLSLNLHISHLIIISWSAIFQNLDFWYTSLSMFLVIAPTLYPFCCGISECLFSLNMIYKKPTFHAMNHIIQAVLPQIRVLFKPYILCASLFNTAFFLTSLNQYKKFYRSFLKN